MEETIETAVLRPDDVIIGLPSTDMAEAIELVGGRLVERGIIDPDYIESMKLREETVSTYLGNGVAMPHGTYDYRDSIKGTGIVVAQYPDGVDWGPGRAHIVIGLAASGDDHVHVLAQMAEVLQDEDVCKELAVTEDRDLLFSTLSGSVNDDDSDEAVDGSAAATVVITNPAGLHARPATLVVELAKGSEAEITITKGDKTATGASIMSVLALGAVVGDTVDVSVSGEDSEDTLAAVIEILTAEEG